MPLGKMKFLAASGKADELHAIILNATDHTVKSNRNRSWKGSKGIRTNNGTCIVEDNDAPVHKSELT
ncbi:hypothetical protein J6590_091701 [Homalodisca vitripennis]|nr:hypothetical protein J6590_091701 [Homalodisca vitripennis]